MKKQTIISAVESFIVTFIAVFVSGVFGAGALPNWNAYKSAIVAVIPAALTAGVRAAQASRRA